MLLLDNVEYTKYQQITMACDFIEELGGERYFWYTILVNRADGTRPTSQLKYTGEDIPRDIWSFPEKI